MSQMAEADDAVVREDGQEAFDEWRVISRGWPNDMSAMTYEKMEASGGIQWPCNAEHPEGTPRLYTDFVFPTDPGYCESWGKNIETGRPRTRQEFQALGANGRAILYGVEWAPPPEVPDDEFPFLLNNGG